MQRGNGVCAHQSVFTCTLRCVCLHTQKVCLHSKGCAFALKKDVFALKKKVRCVFALKKVQVQHLK